MDFEQVCKNRYSARDFSDKKVEKAKVMQILDLIKLAPTALNKQPYKILIAENERAVEKLKNAKATLYGAPCAFIICSDRKNSWANRYSGEENILIDIGIVAATAMYAATEYGLDSCCVCNFNPDLLRGEFDLPENLTADALILLGYANGGSEPSERHFLRRSVEEFAQRV